MTGAAPASSHLHGTVVVVREAGILILGPSGSGKTSLATALLADARAKGWFGRLVADDRVIVTATHGRLVARPAPALAGVMERRGFGMIGVDHEPACVIRLVVDLVAADAIGERYPDRTPRRTVAQVDLPLIMLASANGARDNSLGVLTTLSNI